MSASASTSIQEETNFIQLINKKYKTHLNTVHKTILDYIFGLNDNGISYQLDVNGNFINIYKPIGYSNCNIAIDQITNYIKTNILTKSGLGLNYVHIPINMIPHKNNPISTLLLDNLDSTCQFVSDYLANNLDGLKTRVTFDQSRDGCFFAIKLTWQFE
jgi:hypothetical protein